MKKTIKIGFAVAGIIILFSSYAGAALVGTVLAGAALWQNHMQYLHDARPHRW